MDTLTKISCKQHSLPVCIHRYHPSFSPLPVSSISLNNRCSRALAPSFASLKIRAFSPNTPPKSPDTHKTLNPFPVISIVKTPISVLIASAAIFFSSFGRKPLVAIAVPTPVVDSVEESAGEERERTLEERVATNPEDVEALKSLMEIKIKKKKLPEAIEVINRLIECEPTEFEWPLLRAHLYYYIGESEMARAGFEEILERDPLRVEAYHGLVMVVSQGENGGKELDKVTRRIEDAMERCLRDKKKDDFRDFKLLVAQVRVVEGNYSEALKVYQELEKDEPRDFRPYLCQGIIYTLLKKSDEAEKQFEKYKRLVPRGHPYAQYFDNNMFATKVFSQMAANERMNVGSKT